MTGTARAIVSLPPPPALAARLFARLGRLAVPAVFLGVWQFASTTLLDDTTRVLLPPPTAVAAAAWELTVNGQLLHHLADSLRREFVAFLWALVAVPLGVAMGWWKLVNDQLDPLIEMLRPIPPLAWIPLSILWFGVGDTQNQFIIFLGIFFPILLNTIAGVRGVSRISCARRAAWAAAKARCCAASLCSPPCRRSSPASASASGSAGWRWSRPSSSAPTPASAF